MNPLILASSNRGYASRYVWHTLSAIAVFVVLCALALIQNSIEWPERKPYMTTAYYDAYGAWVMLNICMCFCAAVIGGYVLSILNAALYKSRTKHVFYKNKDGKWNKARRDTCSFPSSKWRLDQNFDRIVAVEVKQTMIDRYMNTGTLELDMVLYGNADSELFTWEIPAIDDPHRQKDLIEASSEAYEGLSVKISRSEA